MIILGIFKNFDYSSPFFKKRIMRFKKTTKPFIKTKKKPDSFLI